ncbi:MAG: ABC transporter permease [Saprospiraceae bacterium]
MSKSFTSITLFLAFAILPLTAGLVYALLYSLGIVGALSQGFSGAAWRVIWADPTFLSSLAVSALVAATSVLLATFIALGLLSAMGTLLERPRVRFLLHFPLAIPPIIAAFLSFQWFGSSGMLARVAGQLGWIQRADDFPPLINDPYYLGVGITMLLLTFPFLLLLFLNYYQSARLEQFSQLAATRGASPAYIRAQVVRPILLRRAFPTLLLYGVFLFGSYEVPLLLGRQSPAMISIFISQKFGRFNLNDLPVAYAATVIYALVVFLIIFVFLRLSRATVQTLPV